MSRSESGRRRRVDLGRTVAPRTLHAHAMPVILILLTFVNMRGIGEAGTLFMLPTCAFILSLGAVVLWGIFATISSGGIRTRWFPRRISCCWPPKRWAHALLRAFASGCTAMTGVEAVSNGVQAFREPVVPAARRTLTLIIIIF